MEFQHMPIINYENSFHSANHRHQQPLNYIVQSLKKSYNDENHITKFGSSSNLSDSAHSSDDSKDGNHGKHHQAAERRHKNFQVKKKTELCKTYQLGLVCPYGNKCSFAHGIEELRNKQLVPANYKTVKCKQFFEKGFCNFGPRCQFLHRAPAETTKTLPVMDHSEVFKALMNSIERKSYDECIHYENEFLDIGSFGTQRLSAFKNF